MAETTEREVATAALIETLERSYPQRGFKIHPSLAFVASEGGSGGLSAKAAAPIKRDEILLVVPESACFSTSNLPNDGADGFQGASLVPLLKDVESKCGRVMRAMDLEVFDVGDFLLAVLVMRAAASVAERDTGWLWPRQAATWPSEDELKETIAFWEYSRPIEIVGESSLRNLLDSRMRVVLQVFDYAVYPSLSERGQESSFILPSVKGRQLASTKDALRASFLYGFIIAYSRSHGGESPALIPLVELFNGMDDEGDTNVAIAGGKWPFIRGEIYVNECNLECSAVYATRDIDEGEELVISYGKLLPSHFLLKYGTIPEQMVSRPDAVDEIDIYCPPELVPSDSARVQALRQAGYPLEELKRGRGKRGSRVSLTTLDGESLSLSRRGGENEKIGSLRQFLIVAHLMNDAEVQLNINTGRLRCNFDQTRLAGLLCEVIGHNLHILSPDGSSSADDIKRANISTSQTESALLLGRICQREALAVWWHHFRDKYSSPSLHGDPIRVPICIQGGACRVCGRTYPIRKCARCKWRGEYKVAKYCSREHQKVDWKVHKRHCQPVSTE